MKERIATKEHALRDAVLEYFQIKRVISCVELTQTSLEAELSSLREEINGLDRRKEFLYQRRDELANIIAGAVSEHFQEE